MTLNMHGGEIGVSFFFVLSGFLITYLMFLENERNGVFNVPLFYARRLLRIWPLYFLTLGVGFLAYPVAARLVHYEYHETASPILYCTFLTNFDHIYFLFPKAAILGVQWSVAIEEQFYLVWPLFFVFTRRVRLFPWMVASLVVTAVVFRGFHANNVNVEYYHTICALNDLGVGALLAYWFFRSPEMVQEMLCKITRLQTVVVYLGGLAFVIVVRDFNLNPLYYVSRLVGAMFFAFVILDQIASPHSFIKVGALPGFTQLGRISYGLYLLHMIPITGVAFIQIHYKMPFLLQVVLALGGTILLSEISYRFFERPFLRLKDRFSPLVLEKARVAIQRE